MFGLAVAPEQCAACAGAAEGQYGLFGLSQQIGKMGGVGGVDGRGGYGLKKIVADAGLLKLLLHGGKIGLVGLFLIGAVADDGADAEFDGVGNVGFGELRADLELFG